MTLGTPTCGERAGEQSRGQLVQGHRVDLQGFARKNHDEQRITSDGVGEDPVKFSLTNIVFYRSFRYISRLEVGQHDFMLCFSTEGNPILDTTSTLLEKEKRGFEATENNCLI